MFDRFSDSVRNVLADAQLEARNMNHDFVGTEHLLLALMSSPSDVLVDLRQRLDLDAEIVRREIESIVSRGEIAPAAGQLPLTPRASQAIELARQTAALACLKEIDAEHLFIGLLREPTGVAGIVLKKLGLESQRVIEEILKLRLLQMKIVERAIRPVRAPMVRKRKMREELLSHLEAIYTQARADGQDPQAAIETAAARFGDPAELSHELQASLPAAQRRGYFFERLFGWRAPETALRYVTRQAVLSFFITLGFYLFFLSLATFKMQIIGRPWDAGDSLVARVSLIMLLLMPLDQFLLGLLFFKLRDSIFGVFGSPQSMRRAWMYTLLFAVVIQVTGFAWVLLGSPADDRPSDFVLPLVVLSSVLGLAVHLVARWCGPTQIRDTIWACLDVG